MRLLSTETFCLEEFVSGTEPDYAILSHTWGDEEISFQAWLEWENRGADVEDAEISSREGFQKSIAFLRTAGLLLYRYGWVDTCCIDKTSSAELTEAINSMFKWYGNAGLCIAYLSDMKSPLAVEMVLCRWFTRGWTLQELIAPKDVVFFNKDWVCVGTKAGLGDILEQATGIGQEYLRSPELVSSASIARRMSWAAERVVSRIEDQAYCLLGIFDVNIPLLYGEGARAFQRLQEEIIKVSTDESIFAWHWPDQLSGSRANNHALEWKIPDISKDDPYCGSQIQPYKPPYATYMSMLAPTPGAFKGCTGIVRLRNIKPGGAENLIFTISNLGLSIRLPVIPLSAREYFAVLSCKYEDEPGLLCVLVGKPWTSRNADEEDADLWVRHQVPQWPLSLPQSASQLETKQLHLPRMGALSRDQRMHPGSVMRVPVRIYVPFILITRRPWKSASIKITPMSWRDHSQANGTAVARGAILCLGYSRLTSTQSHCILVQVRLGETVKEDLIVLIFSRGDPCDGQQMHCVLMPSKEFTVEGKELSEQHFHLLRRQVWKRISAVRHGKVIINLGGPATRSEPGQTVVPAYLDIQDKETLKRPDGKCECDERLCRAS